jgi:hypothetical protein
LNLEVAAAQLQLSESEIAPIILFSGNFSYNLNIPEIGNSLTAASRILANWQTDISAYYELITERFLNHKTSLNPLPTITTKNDDFDGIEIIDAPDIYPLVIC